MTSTGTRKSLTYPIFELHLNTYGVTFSPTTYLIFEFLESHAKGKTHRCVTSGFSEIDNPVFK